MLCICTAHTSLVCTDVCAAYLNVEISQCPLVDCPCPRSLCHAFFLILVALDPQETPHCVFMI